MLGFLLTLLPMVGADPVTVSATVDSYITATFNYASISYGTLSAGSSDNPAPNQGVVPGYNISIDTNKEFKVEASGTDFSDGTNTFGIANLKMDSDTAPASLALLSAVTLSGTPQTIDTGIAYTTTDHYHGFWLTIPSGQYANAYSSTVTVTYSVV